MPRNKPALKLLDEVLLAWMRELKLQPAQVEKHNSLTRDAVQLLRRKYTDGQMASITLTWANYFEEKYGSKDKPDVRS